MYKVGKAVGLQILVFINFVSLAGEYFVLV